MQNPKSGKGWFIGKLIAGHVRDPGRSPDRGEEQMVGMGERAPPVGLLEREARASGGSLHVGDFLCTGGDSLRWLFDTLKKKYGLKEHLVEPGSQKEVRFFSRMPRREYMGQSGSVPRSMRERCGEYGMDGCRELASKARRGIDIINCMAQDRPDFAVATRVESQMMAGPIEGNEPCLEHSIPYLALHPRGVLLFPRGLIDEPLRIWTDSDWVGDAT